MIIDNHSLSNIRFYDRINSRLQEHHLRAVRHLPGIIRLQRMLSQRFHRNIDSAEAVKVKVADFLNKLEEGENLHLKFHQRVCKSVSHLK